MKSVIIIGGGLVGSLCACYMAKRGFDVQVYEQREDIRQAKEVTGRSINLNLSHRGRKALQEIGIEETILDAAIPMKGRMLHSVEGDLKFVPYDSVFDQCGYSISRAFLNKKLLDEAEKYPNVRLHFRHKLLKANFKDRSITVTNLVASTSFEKQADLIIGADGAYSALRNAMQRSHLFQYSQHYIPHGYLELSVEPKLGDKLSRNSLHIWPRGQFMMIALPNIDDSWTVTLFMPFDKFNALKEEGAALEFFRREFRDAVPLLGEGEIARRVQGELLPLVSVKCDPFHVDGKFLLIGDAAHAIVPFYGQGMNAGFEDCTILNECLDAFPDDAPAAISAFSKRRVRDAHTISDLAMYNYVEMRDLVNKKSFRLRKTLDEILFSLFPTRWIPLYWSVCFSSMEYSKCLENKTWQDKVVTTCTAALFFVAIPSLLLLVWCTVMN